MKDNRYSCSRYNRSQQFLNLMNLSLEWEKIIKQNDWAQLKYLRADGCNILGKSIQTFTSTAKWQSLKQLKLNNNSICSEGIKWLVKLNMPNIQIILLGTNGIIEDHCSFGSQGLKHIIKGNWKALRQLSVSGNYQKQNLTHEADWPSIDQLRVDMPHKIQNLGLVLFPNKRLSTYLRVHQLQNNMEIAVYMITAQRFTN